MIKYVMGREKEFRGKKHTLMLPCTSFLTTSEKNGLEKASKIRKNIVMASVNGPTFMACNSPSCADSPATLNESMIWTKN